MQMFDREDTAQEKDRPSPRRRYIAGVAGGLALAGGSLIGVSAHETGGGNLDETISGVGIELLLTSGAVAGLAISGIAADKLIHHRDDD